MSKYHGVPFEYIYGVRGRFGYGRYRKGFSGRKRDFYRGKFNTSAWPFRVPLYRKNCIKKLKSALQINLRLILFFYTFFPVNGKCFFGLPSVTRLVVCVTHAQVAFRESAVDREFIAGETFERFSGIKADRRKITVVY